MNGAGASNGLAAKTEPVDVPYRGLIDQHASAGSGIDGIAGISGFAAAPGVAGRAGDSIASLQHLSGSNRLDQMSKALLASNLLMPEKQPEEGKKKHSHHWKYEDPAITLKDVLG